MGYVFQMPGFWKDGRCHHWWHSVVACAVQSESLGALWGRPAICPSFTFFAAETKAVFVCLSPD